MLTSYKVICHPHTNLAANGTNIKTLATVTFFYLCEVADYDQPHTFCLTVCNGGKTQKVLSKPGFELSILGNCRNMAFPYGGLASFVDTLLNLVENLPRRVEAVIAAKGGTDVVLNPVD